MKEDGGPAFPVKEYMDAKPGDITWGMHHGMTLRQWYAGTALMALIRDQDPLRVQNGKELYTTVAFELADAMIAEGSKE